MAEQQMQLSQRQQDSSGQWNEAIGLRQASPQPPETPIEGQGAADDGANDAEQVQNPVDAITRLRLDVFAMVWPGRWTGLNGCSVDDWITYRSLRL